MLYFFFLLFIVNIRSLLEYEHTIRRHLSSCFDNGDSNDPDVYWCGWEDNEMMIG